MTKTYQTTSNGGRFIIQVKGEAVIATDLLTQNRVTLAQFSHPLDEGRLAQAYAIRDAARYGLDLLNEVSRFKWEEVR